MAPDNPIIQTLDLESTFQSLRNRDPSKIERQVIKSHPDYKRVPRQNYAPTTSVNTGSWGNGMARFASVASNPGIIYGQPQFFSPVHTPINWQIPSKRLEQYQWARFFYENEPKVASSIDFYSYFPIHDYSHDCKDRSVKKHFDKLKKKLNLVKWLRLISHEIHLLGDCFPFIEISCPQCYGSGRVGSEICEHEGGTVRRIVILNPDYVEVFTDPMNPDPMIALKPDETLINMVQKKTPGYERLTPEVIKLISAGQPIRLDNRNVSHLMYGEGGYTRYGVGMVRRLFPILSYKTKLMVAQWIVAERLIVPIKVVKVGSDTRPAGPADIAAVQQQLAATANDPNLTIVTHHTFELEWHGAAGKVLTLSNEFEFINQEVLDGMMINNALLNGEGPNFSNAAVGIEAMIQRLKTYQKELSDWVEEFIYLPESIRQGFIEENPETGEREYIYPTIKWDKMHLRDQQQDKTFSLQLYEKGLLSAQTVLEVFDYDPDTEIERKRYDAIQMVGLAEGMGGAGGGMPGMPGGEMGGGGMPGMPGGEMGGGMPGGEMGGMGGAPPMAGGAPPGGSPIAPGGPPLSNSMRSVSSENADPSQFGGKVLKQRTRERIDKDRQKIYQQEQKKQQGAQKGADGQMRDEKGRIIYTAPERELMDHLIQYSQNGLIRYPIVPQWRVQCGSTEYPLDFGLPQLKIGIEVDGEMFHGSPKQIAHDKERDMKLAQLGWTILRFNDDEVNKRAERVMSTIVKVIMQKEVALKNLVAGDKS